MIRHVCYLSILSSTLSILRSALWRSIRLSRQRLGIICISLARGDVQIIRFSMRLPHLRGECRPRQMDKVELSTTVVFVVSYASVWLRATEELMIDESSQPLPAEL